MTIGLELAQAIRQREEISKCIETEKLDGVTGEE